MRFSERWLRQWVDPPVGVEGLGERLTLAGLEVESVVPAAPVFAGVVIAEVKEVRVPAEAPQMRLCTVAVGAAGVLEAACAEGEVRPGARVALAREGATLPGGRRVEARRLAGVDCRGMLCSAAQLGLEGYPEGVLQLPPEAPLGEDLRTYLELEDVCIEVNVTPNRGDCLSLRGLAREVAAEHGCPWRDLSVPAVPPALPERLPVRVLAAAACPRYVGRVIRGVRAGAPTPPWLRERLRRCGLRSVNCLVDVTNYVMLELGQPLHAFDLGKLRGGIEVRLGREGEALQLLDGQRVALDGETLVIADAGGPIALAGVMGGLATAVTDATTDVFLESAFFTPAALAGRARRYGLQTESSYRFERGVDSAIQAAASERATALILALCGGGCGPLIEVSDAHGPPRRPPVLLRRGRLERMLGYSLAEAEVEAILRRLGLAVTEQAEGWEVAVPSWRFDLEQEVDLIEELARLGGYERVPTLLPRGGFVPPPVPEGTLAAPAALRRTLCARGYREAITYSFVDPELNEAFAPPGAAIALANPISTDRSAMRVSLWPGLLGAARYNQNRQHPRVRLFEFGRVFSRVGGKVLERDKVAGIATGTALPEQWAERARPLDFFDLKGDVEALLGAKRAACEVRPAEHPALHPRQAAAVVAGQAVAGVFGALHPELVRKADLEGPVYVFELDLDFLARVPVPRYQPLSRFPSLRRDICVVLDRSVAAAQVIDCVRSGAPTALRDLQLFDVYEGEGIDPGKKSIALGLTFQELSRTLIDEEVEEMVAEIVRRLEHELGARLRK